MATAVVSAITDGARAAFATMLETGLAFTITHFVTGSGGHDPGDPTVALTPNPADTTLPSQTFGPKAVTAKTLISPYCIQVTCDLADLEAVGPLSNIGLIATYTYPNSDPEFGNTFLFSIGNFPLKTKTDSESITFFIEVNY